jgi:phage terminase large subunit
VATGTNIPPPRVLDNSEWPPDYVQVYRWRHQQIQKFRRNPGFALAAFEYYRTHWAEFICHFFDTLDPRNASGEKPARLPFVLFRRQGELVEFLRLCLMDEAAGLVEKSRDMGATWLAGAVTVCIWLFMDGSSVLWGSRQQDLVDKLGVPDSILEKIRILIRGLPSEFLPLGIDFAHNLSFMRLVNPQNNSVITGGIGDNIGRGGRSLACFKDESAHYEHPEMIEAALGDTTRVQIDISSVNGTGNVFYRKREAGVDWVPGAPVVKGKTNVFVLDWRDHPEKTQAWYDERRAKAEEEGLLHVFAQEVDRDYAASVEGVIIPGELVKAAIDAHVKLKFDDSGGWVGALDVADTGGDTNALALRKGVILKTIDQWGARDPGITTRRAIEACRGLGPLDLQYDSIGVGAGVKTEANRLSDEHLMPEGLRLVSWNAGAEVLHPDKRVVPGDRNSPLNKDFYTNLKAQGWWQLRIRFQKTWRALNDPKFTWTPDELISLPRGLPLIRRLEKELSQPTASQGARMKLIVDKTPDGTHSPNLADAVMMAYWPMRGNFQIQVSPALMARAVKAGMNRMSRRTLR